MRVNFRGKVPSRSFAKAVISWDYTDQGDHLELGAKFCFTSRIKDAAKNPFFESQLSKLSKECVAHILQNPEQVCMTLKRISPAWNYTLQIPNEERVLELMYAHLLV